MTGILTDLGIEAVQFGYWLYDRARKARSPTLTSSDSPGNTGTASGFLNSAPASPELAASGAPRRHLRPLHARRGLGTLAFREFPRFVMFPPCSS